MKGFVELNNDKASIWWWPQPLIPLPHAARPVFSQPPPEGHLTDPTNHLLNLNLRWILQSIFMLKIAFWFENRFLV